MGEYAYAEAASSAQLRVINAFVHDLRRTDQPRARPQMRKPIVPAIRLPLSIDEQELYPGFPVDPRAAAPAGRAYVIH